jgi:hypothetical protein
MEDAYKDEITAEEQAILNGELPTAPAADTKAEPEKKEGPDTPPEKEPEGEKTPEGEKKDEAEKKETEPTPEEKAAAEEAGLFIETDDKGRQYIVDEDGKRIPPQRFGKVFRAAKEGEQYKTKLDLFKKLGPEGYYTAYPDEKPEGWTASGKEHAKEAAPVTIPRNVNMGDIGVVYEDKEMTLRDLYTLNPVEATRLQNLVIDQWRQEDAAKKGDEEREAGEKRAQIESLGNSLSKEMFNKEGTALSESEMKSVVEVLAKVEAHKDKTPRYKTLSMGEVYFLMNAEGIFKKIADVASRAALKSITERKGPASIDTGAGGDVKPTGFEAVEKMTADQLEKHIDAMTDADMNKFLREAPKSIREKLPSAPWK